MTQLENRTLKLYRSTGSVEYDGLPVFIIPRELLVGSAEEFAKVFDSLLGKGMIGMYRMGSHKMGEKIFHIHLPPGAEGKAGTELLDLVFNRFIESGWGRYSYKECQKGYEITVENFWLGQGLKGMDKKPVCALMEGILNALFTRAFNRQVRVSETACGAIGNPFDKFEIVFQSP